MNEALLPICGFLLFIGVVVASICWRRHLEKKRREALRACARRLSFSFCATDDGLMATLKSSPCELFARGGNSASVENILQGVEGSSTLRVFDFSYVVSSGKNSSTILQTVVQIQTEGLSFPPFNLRPERLFHKIGNMFGYQDIDFHEHVLFSKKFLLRGANEAAIRSAFQDTVIRFFEQRPHMSAESDGTSLFLYQAQRLLKAGEIAPRIREAMKLSMDFVQ